MPSEPSATIVLARSVLTEYRQRIEQAAGGRVRLLPDDEPALAVDTTPVDAVLADIDDAVLEHLLRAPGLSWVHAMSSGVDHLPVARLQERGVILTNSAGAYSAAIAEYALGAMVMLTRGFSTWLEAQRAVEWRAPASTPSVLHGKRLGIVGYGAVGRHLAGICKAIGMEVWATRRGPPSRTGDVLDRQLTPRELPVLLGGSDVVVLTASLNETTRNLIGEAELRLMRPSAVLINVARGALIDEGALEQALRDSRIAGAMLDVTRDEPLPVDSPLWATPNLYVTPHLAGYARESLDWAIELFCANLELFLDGSPDRMGNVVDYAAIR